MAQQARIDVCKREVAAISMSGTTLIVAINALMLKRSKLAGIRQPGNDAFARIPAAAAAAPQPT